MKVCLFILVSITTIFCFSIKEKSINDDSSAVYFPDDKIFNNGQEQETTTVFVIERNLFKVRSNCEEGERMDKYGRCRQAFK